MCDAQIWAGIAFATILVLLVVVICFRRKEITWSAVTMALVALVFAGASSYTVRIRDVFNYKYGTQIRCQLHQLPQLALFRITDPAVVTLPWPDDAWATPLPGVRQRYAGRDGDAQDRIRPWRSWRLGG